MVEREGTPGRQKHLTSFVINDIEVVNKCKANPNNRKAPLVSRLYSEPHVEFGEG